jgi:hypothetical protein
MTEQFIIVSSTDQALPADTNEELFHLQKLVEQSMQERDPEIVLAYCADIVRTARVSGFLIIKALYQLSKHWDEYEIGDSFKATVYARIGLDKYTVNRYLKAAEVMDDMPPEQEAKLANKNVRDIIPITNTIAQGYEIEEEKLEEIIEAPDYQTTMNLLRKAKGIEPTFKAAVIKIDDKGQLWVWNENNVAHIGFLKVDSEDKLVQKAIKRILDSSGVIGR